MQYGLLKPAQILDRIDDSISALDVPLGIRIPQAHLQHVVRFVPSTVSKTERVEDLQCAGLHAICLAVENLIAQNQD